MRHVLLATAAACGVVTLGVALVPSLHFAYRLPALHAALETTAALVILVAMFLVFGRLRGRPGVNELLLAAALSLLGPWTVIFGSLAAVVRDGSHSIATWEAQLTSVCGAILLAGAALSPPRRLVRLGRRGVVSAVAVLWLLALTALLASLANAGFGDDGATAVSRAAVHTNPAQLTLNTISAVAFGLAAIGFLRRAERRGDEFLAWLAVVSVVSAFSRVNYALFPTRYTDWVYVGDGFRLVSYLVLLVAAMREISSYWRTQAHAAVLEERRRIARDLHDGLAQEIAYLGRNLRSLRPADAEQTEQFERLRQAAERAHIESRQALHALSAPPDEPLAVALARAATDVADRFGAALELDLMPGVRVSAPRAECLMRIACEAVANAARHSGARQIALTLEGVGARVRLRVHDHGCGFDIDAPSAGFGLISMRERAQAVGGLLAVDSAPGRGTLVEVAL